MIAPNCWPCAHRAALTFLAALCGAPLLQSCDLGGDATSFELEADLDDDTCGDGLVDADSSWEADVDISVEGDEILWDNFDTGESLTGAYDDGDFTIVTSDTVTVGTDDDGNECRVKVRSVYAGELEEDGTSLSGLSAELTITYSEASGYDCDGFIDDDDGFAELSCRVVYDIDGSPED